MDIQKRQVVDFIEVFEDGSVHARTKTQIIENGNQIAATFKSNVIAPGDDYSNQDSKVQAVCEAIHTQEVVTAYQSGK